MTNTYLCGPTGKAPALTRRVAMLAGLAGLAGAIAPAHVWSQVAQGTQVTVAPPLQQLLHTVCDLVIPATDTPGALAAGVPDFVLVGLAHGLSGETHAAGSAAIASPPAAAPAPVGDIDVLERVAAQLDARAKGPFVSMAPADQVRLLTDLDAEAYANARDPKGADWRMLKSLILTGYYTSEPGGSVELQYELVPGRFDPDLPLPPSNRAFSSDWTAVQFG